MKPVTIHAEAEAEIEAASDYYEERREGLGAEFEEEIQAAVERIARLPLSFPQHDGDYRKCILRRFPYTVYFLDREADVWIAAVAHQKRKPGYWEHRTPAE